MVSFHEGSGLHIVDAGDDSAAQVDYGEIHYKPRFHETQLFTSSLIL